MKSAVISNIGWPQSALSQRIGRLFPKNRFYFIITSSKYLVCKPNPPIFQLALNKADILPREAWYCGDNPYADIRRLQPGWLFPIWYDSDIDCFYRDRWNKAAADFPICA
ncbi:MAG: HAD family hydrolase [Christensenellales bacterium]|jgi:FMN phosphatase YigB (HAD superfamily)